MKKEELVMERKVLTLADLILSKINLEKPYKINKMGTSGLREKQEVYNQPYFIEQFAQGLADYYKSLPIDFRKEKGNTVIIGGDPRRGNAERIRIIASILAANGIGVIIVDGNVASTPAMSHAIRALGVMGGIILTASHNPATDVGIKVNNAEGAPALEDIVDPIHQFQNNVKVVNIADFKAAKEAGRIMRVDATAFYADLMDKIFNFEEMKADLAAWEQQNGRAFRIALDGMNGAAGPFIKKIFQEILGFTTDKDSVFIHVDPREDLGGEDYHPEPDFDFLPELIELNATRNYDLVGAYDSDVDRRLDGGANFWLESADEFALFTKYGDLIGIEKLFVDPAGKAGEIVFARSTVTAHTIDLMEAYLRNIYEAKGYQVRILETDTGFKFIAEQGNYGVEESNGVGNPWLREKDGIFATLFLLKILLKTGKTPQQLMEEMWREFGRVYFTRGEVSGSDTDEKQQLTELLDKVTKTNEFIGRQFGTLKLESAEKWGYIDPKGVQRTKESVWVLRFSDGNVIKARYSGTGSGGYQLRVYASKYDKRYDLPKSEITQPMKDAFDALLEQLGFSGKSKKYTDANQPDPYKQQAA